MVSRYQEHISGPLLDRIDIHIEVPRVEHKKLTDYRLSATLTWVRLRLGRTVELTRRGVAC